MQNATQTVLTKFINKIKPQQFVNEQGMTIKIVRTRRKKTLAVKVEGGDVSVIVPERTSLSHIESLVARKSNWIQQKLLQQDNQAPVKKHEYIEGERFLYLGDEKTLNIVTGTTKSIKINDSSIIVSSNQAPTPNNIKNRLKKWYQTQAQLYLAKRTKYFAKIIGVKPRLVNTRTYSARWGCCSNRREITYNWQIIMAPEHIIDYIVVHELCHIKEHNHSPEYWALLEAVMPDYKERKEWLFNNEKKIHL